MRRCKVSANFVALGCICLLVVTAHAEKSRLNLFIWSEYIDPAVIAGFEQQFDCKVVLDLYEDEDSMMSKLQGGGVSLYDVIVPSNLLTPALIKMGMLARLRQDALPNRKNLDERFANPPYDPGNKFTVPFQWGTVGIYARRAKGQAVNETWALLFDPKKQPGQFVLIDSMRDLIGSALKYHSHSLNSTNVAELKAARALLLAAKHRSLGFDNAAGGKNRLLARGAAAAIVYSGDAVRGMSEDAETYYFIPKEGSQIWMDNLAIPAKAPHHELAEKFLNYILDAKVGAQQANFSQYATPNHAAKVFISPADLRNPAIYPPPETMAKLEFLTDLGPNIRLYDEIWTQVKLK
jgi:spermidine/putrescine transport system substrate-binding protein